jgi:hypothetical protein
MLAAPDIAPPAATRKRSTLIATAGLHRVDFSILPRDNPRSRTTTHALQPGFAEADRS